MQQKPFYIALLIGALLTILMTLVFYFTDLDLTTTGFFYDSAGPSRFPVGETMPWIWFYENEKNLLYVLAAFILFLLILGLTRPRFRAFTVYALFMLLSLGIGPGLLANVLFKGVDIGDFYIGWGRPRPREIVFFSGSDPFYRIWEPAFLDGYRNTNSSFPSGHVTVGAIFIVIFFAFNNVDFIARIFGEKTRAKVAVLNTIKYTGLVASIVLGIMFSIARISAGAHFASDCLYSFVFTWLPTVVLYYWVFNIPKLERRAQERLEQAATKNTK